jgi:hypothetical protein
MKGTTRRRGGRSPGGPPTERGRERQNQPFIPQYYPDILDERSSSAHNFGIYVGFTVLGLVTTIGTALLIRHFIKKGKQKTTETKTTETGNPANYAKLLQMAFQNDNAMGWGTNEELVYKVFNSLPSQAFYKDVQKAYDKMTKGRSLNADLADELDTDEYNKVLNILQSKKMK